ncbi:MAG TPA: hypothetical protein VNQ81_15180 [Povalibacter sp.]|nr:hypothetical protein [Povalibacter sp.]
MPNNPTLKIAAVVSVSLTVLITLILALLARHVITYQMALLMFVGLLGLYVGFGVLFAAYRFISRLD